MFSHSPFLVQTEIYFPFFSKLVRFQNCSKYWDANQTFDSFLSSSILQSDLTETIQCFFPVQMWIRGQERVEWENLFLPVISWFFDCLLEIPSAVLCSFNKKFFCKPKEISHQNIFEVCSVLQLSFLVDRSWGFEMEECF